MVALVLHGGLDSAAYSPTMENPGLHLSKVAGIDAMVMGHQHGVFPDTGSHPQLQPARRGYKAGTVNGARRDGQLLGQGPGRGATGAAVGWCQWVVNKAASKSELRNIQSKNAAGANVYVEPDATIAALIETQHQAAIKYVKTPIGQTDFRMSTLFADVGDPRDPDREPGPANVAAYIKANLPQYAALPGAVGERTVQDQIDRLRPRSSSPSAPPKGQLTRSPRQTHEIDDLACGQPHQEPDVPASPSRGAGVRDRHGTTHRRHQRQELYRQAGRLGTIWARLDANRDVVIDYIRKNSGGESAQPTARPRAGAAKATGGAESVLLAPTR